MADFFLRFRIDAEGRGCWLRRSLWSLGWARTSLLECATRFASEADAIAFTAQYRISDQVEVVTVQAKEARRAR